MLSGHQIREMLGSSPGVVLGGARQLCLLPALVQAWVEN